MTKNPLINACAALIYISAISTFLFNIQYLFGHQPDTLMAPVIMLSLFVFSAAMMGYFFLYQPVQMFLEGHKREGANLFVRTLACFGAITIALVVVWAYISRSL